MNRIWLFLLWFPMVAQAEESADALKARVLARAANEGVPAAPLERKIAEGVAKGVPTELIARVVDGLHTRLREAAARCGGWERRDECALAGADALQVGLPAPALDALLAQGEAEEERLQALFAVSDLHSRGVPTELGIALVGQVRGRGPAAAHELVRGIMDAIDAGGSPADVARQVLDRGPPDREGNFRGKKEKDKPGKAPETVQPADRPHAPATERPIAPSTAPGQGHRPK